MEARKQLKLLRPGETTFFLPDGGKENSVERSLDRTSANRGTSEKEFLEVTDALRKLKSRADAARQLVMLQVQRQVDGRGSAPRSDLMSSTDLLGTYLDMAQMALSKGDLKAAPSNIQREQGELARLDELLAR